MTFGSLVATTLATIGLSVLLVPTAMAEMDEDPSRMEFLWACAACHGPTGTGDGGVGEMLTVPVPDLTQLSANNDGKFPMLDVIHIIDGRTGVRAHGTEMPVWGSIFKSEVGGERGTFGAETVVRGRILSLAYYLEDIQE